MSIRTVYSSFRPARNCIASCTLVDAYQAPELQLTLDRWVARTREMTAPLLVAVKFGRSIDFAHRQAASCISQGAITNDTEARARGEVLAAKEATARIKINRLLEEAGWRFFDDDQGRANIVLEPNTKITENQIDALGDDFETTKNGFIDFLLLDNEGRPLIVLEAKSEGKNPLAAKEQARRYAREQNARFVILSNGNIH